jgi:hypothetical protein
MNNWSQVSFWGILREGNADDSNAAFHAGHVSDILVVDQPPFFQKLAATQSSGVWLVNENASIALPLSTDWEFPAVKCLANGVIGATHVYAGGDSLYETDTNSFAPLLNWKKVNIINAKGDALNVGFIYQIATVPEPQRIVLATATGIYWSRINGIGAYAFEKAPFLPDGAYSGLAAGPGRSLVVGALGSDGVHYGLFYGEWINNVLLFQRASVFGNVNPSKMQYTDIGSCATNKNILYAISGGGRYPALDGNGNYQYDNLGQVIMIQDDFIYRVLKSEDGGQTWKVTGNKVTNSTQPLFAGKIDIMGHTQGGYNLCIAVSPFNPNLVAVGVGGFCISADGGKNWKLFNEGSSRHLHTDIHCLYFDLSDYANKIKLSVGSDGGLSFTTDLGNTFDTSCNRQFPCLQFYRFGVSYQNSGVIAGSTQDNGNLYTMQYPDPNPWTELDGGDGVSSMFIRTGNFIRQNNMLAYGSVEIGNRARMAKWDDVKLQFSDMKFFPQSPLSLGVIPVDGINDGLENAVQEIVNSPIWRNNQGELMLAVAVRKESVFGLCQTKQGSFHWIQLSNIPHKPDKDASGNELPYYGTATSSSDGTGIFVGTNNGKIFFLDANNNWKAKDTTPVGSATVITRFVVHQNHFAFLITGALVYHYDGNNWSTVPGTGLPVGVGYAAIETDWTQSPKTLYVATTNKIYASMNNGATWADVSAGLPRSANCQDIRFVVEKSKATFLYVSTYGWSVYRKLLNHDSDDQMHEEVIIEGHMDLVDRVAVGHDIWAHPKFSNNVKVGPLHPYKEIEIVEDDGDEIQVKLKFKIQWYIGQVVDVIYEAKLIAKDEDNFVDDSQTGDIIKLPHGNSAIKTIDMASDEWWPDRAHIEFKVTNS